MSEQDTEHDVEDRGSLPAIVGSSSSVPQGWAHSFSSWIDLFHSVPGAAAAIAKFIGGLGQAGAAGVGIGTSAAQAKSKNIEVAGQAKDMVHRALAEAAIKRIDPAMADRALNHFAKDILDKQENREAVTIKALEHIKDDPAESVAKEPPTDDFFNLFGTFAERASSKKMREHFALLLAGEIRRPGTFSFTAMQMASILDQHLAQMIERVTSYSVMNMFIPQYGHLTTSPGLDDILALSSIGFLHVGVLSNQVPIDHTGRFNLIAHNIFMTGKGIPNSNLTLNTFIISIAGRQLLNILSLKPAPDYEEFMRGAFSAVGASELTFQTLPSIAMAGS